ncbi:MAG TPA: phage Gp37/Gp68 family protein [Xanthobacteraceae bacterium]|nr:phage Gp37/Gp68 family protein [Xanthobacteraceae bacterium]
MSGPSKIEWTERTWNPIVGCSIVSPGCTNCYAMRMAARIEAINAATPHVWKGSTPHYAGLTKKVKGHPVWTGKVARADDDTLHAPLRRKKPTVYFVNSMSDLFHESIPDEWIDQVFAVMALAPQHTFQVLTKRAERMRAWFEERWQPAPSQTLPDGFEIPAERRGETRRSQVERACEPLLEALGLVDTERDELWTDDGKCKAMQWQWPLPNVWLGVSAEDQRHADERIPHLLATPAAVRFVSAEPLLEPITLKRLKVGSGWQDALSGWRHCEDYPGRENLLDWVIVGGESGPGARPMHPNWPRWIRDQCAAAGVPFFFKQWGSFAPVGWVHADSSGTLVRPDGRICRDRSDLATSNNFEMRLVGKKAAGRLLDGVEHNGMPGAENAR